MRWDTRRAWLAPRPGTGGELPHLLTSLAGRTRCSTLSGRGAVAWFGDPARRGTGRVRARRGRAAAAVRRRLAQPPGGELGPAGRAPPARRAGPRPDARAVRPARLRALRPAGPGRRPDAGRRVGQSGRGG